LNLRFELPVNNLLILHGPNMQKAADTQSGHKLGNSTEKRDVHLSCRTQLPHVAKKKRYHI
jgi:hypothetical protein